jgi:peroxiredoxin
MILSTTTIAQQVAELRANIETQPRNEVFDVFDREQSTLATQGEPSGVLSLGSTLPDVDLIGADGRPTTLSEVAGGRPAVVVFYRGAWCPYCNITLSNYQNSLLPALSDRGVDLIAVSPQNPDGSLTMQQKHDLAFAVLSDPGNVLAHLLGIVTSPSSEVRAAQLQLGLDLTVVNADGTTSIPRPTTAIIDSGRVLQWIDVHPDYSTRSEAEDIIAALDALSL